PASPLEHSALRPFVFLAVSSPNAVVMLPPATPVASCPKNRRRFDPAISSLSSITVPMHLEVRCLVITYYTNQSSRLQKLGCSDRFGGTMHDASLKSTPNSR